MTDEHDLQSALMASGLIENGAVAMMTPLTGGVASDIWLVETRDRKFVVKRALEKLKVAADWRVPVDRNKSEVAWFSIAAEAIPDAVPKILAHRPELGLFAMDYLPADSHPVWKKELRDGRTDPEFARQLGAVMATLHRHTARSPALAARVNGDALFRAIRLEPYFEFTIKRHPDLSAHLAGLVQRTISTHTALVHGDVSPKNILVGPDGPVILDAECAWYGDPAFDVAFCANHLLLKCIWNPKAISGFLACFEALTRQYLSEIDWEEASDFESRAAWLLPALMLARIDGKSPVEYITEEQDKQTVREFARGMITDRISSLGAISQAWGDHLARGRSKT